MWKTVKLEEVATIISGQSPTGENYNKEGLGMPFYQGKKDYGDRFLKPPKVWTKSVTKVAIEGDVLMSVRAPVGALNIATEEICIGRGLAAIRVHAEIDKDYLFYALAQISDGLTGTSGAIFNSINKKQIESIEFPLPPLAEQQRIVAKLDAAFAEIDGAISLNDGRVSHQSVLINNFIDKIFSNVIGKEMLLNDACDLITCGVAARPQYVETGVPFLSAQNVKNGTVLYRNHKYITEEKHLELTKHNKPAKGDILYTRVGSYGEAAVIEEDTEFSIFVSLTLIKVNQYLTSHYLKYFLNSQKVKRLAARSISGSGVGNLNVGTVRRFPIVVPDIAAQQEIISRLGQISLHHFELMSCLNAKSAALKQLKSSILAQELRSEAA